ncbi:MAG: hypothetical protein E7345_03975 [Clostridiales bacterium]|nr:hypothetical protein [Clostridiales bacterium]
MASTKRYFGLSWIVCVILAIIPVTSIICGIVTRVQRGHVLGAILNFILCPIFYIIDIVTMLLSKDITFLA